MLMDNAKPERLGRELDSSLQGYRMNYKANRMDAAMDCIEQASALALFAYGREHRQMGKPLSDTELEQQLRCGILPHQNRGNIKNRSSEIVEQVQNILSKSAAPGIRSARDKEQLASAWLELAVMLAKIPVKYDADILKQQQKQEKSAAMKMEVG